MKVLNHDIANLVKRLRRFRKEMIKSVSSNISELSVHDKTRLMSYLGAIKSFKAWAVSQPDLDMPETAPLEIELNEADPIPSMENDDLEMVVNLFDIIEKELINSQSARRSTGMISHDATRFDTYVEKIELFVNDFIGSISPLDLPESSPSSPITGAGNTGI